MRVIAGFLTVALSAAGTAFSQTEQTLPERARLRGLVRDTERKVWVGAKVVLVSRPVPGNEWVGKADRIETTTDKRGRFQARIRPSQRYVVWATSAPEQDGTYRSTEAKEVVFDGRPIQLRERNERLVQVKIRINAGDAWKDMTPFTACVTSAAFQWNPYAAYQGNSSQPPFLARFKVDDSGVCTLPLLPFTVCAVEVFGNGLQLWTQQIVLEHRERKTAVGTGKRRQVVTSPFAQARPEKMESITSSVISVPEPLAMKFQVVKETKKGKGIAGASIYQIVRGRATRIATTDKTGLATVKLPKGLRPNTPYSADARLVVRAEGYAEAPAADTQNAQNLLLGLGQLGQTANKSKATVVLKKGYALRGRLMLDAETPLANAPVLLHMLATTQAAMVFGPGFGNNSGLLVGKTDKDGKFAFPRQLRGRYFIRTILDDNLCARVGKGTQVHAEVCVAKGDAQAEKDYDLGDLIIGELRRLTLNVKTKDGSPVRGAEAVVFDSAGNFNQMQRLLVVPTRRRGVLSILVPNMKRLKMLIYDDVGYKVLTLSSLAADVKSLDVTLEEATTIAGVVKNRKGKAAPDVFIQCHGAVIRAIDEYYMFMQALSHKTTATTDAQGRFSVWLAGDHAQARLNCMQWDGIRARGTTQVVLDVSEGSISDAEIQLKN